MSWLQRSNFNERHEFEVLKFIFNGSHCIGSWQISESHIDARHFLSSATNSASGKAAVSCWGCWEIEFEVSSCHITNWCWRRSSCLLTWKTFFFWSSITKDIPGLAMIVFVMWERSSNNSHRFWKTASSNYCPLKHLTLQKEQNMNIAPSI